MNTELIERAMQIVEDAVELPEDEQQEFLDRACGSDLTLRREVESMLVFDSGISIESATADHELEDALFTASPSSDRYELFEVVGRGGMGTVFRGHDRQLDREIAIKVLHDSARNTADGLRRFVAESQIGARLQHPGIAPVHDVGRLPDGRPFFAMKLVRGKTMASLLSARCDAMIDRSRLLSVFEQLCQTIAYAHARGIIHRDLKPDNVMVGEFGEVQVMDWGLAKVISDGDPMNSDRIDSNDDHDLPQSSSSWSPSSGSETRVGIVMGTPAYMPPEQASGKRSKSTDVFSLGAILCEILTGAPPYVAESPAQVLDKSAHADLREAHSRLANCQADPELVDLAKQCLKPNREDRPADAGEVAHRFSSYLQTVRTRLQEAEIATARSAAVALEEKKRRRVTVALMATALAMLTLGLGSWNWISAERAQRVEERAKREQEAAARQTRIVQQLNDAKTEAIRLRQVAVDAPLDDLAAWAQTRTAVYNAESILAANDLPPQYAEEIATLAREVARQEADRQLLAEIERAREQATEDITIPDGPSIALLDRRRVALERFFRDHQLHPSITAADKAIEHLNAKDDRIKDEIVGALDEWMVLCSLPSTCDWLVAVTSGVDKNAWRSEWRKAVLSREAEVLIAMSKDDSVLKQKPRSVINLYYSLQVTSPDFDAPFVLERVYPLHPGDFWLCFELGETTRFDPNHNWDVRIGYYEIAAAIRPLSYIFRMLGEFHLYSGRIQKSLDFFERAVQLNPQSAQGWSGLGATNMRLENLDEARAAYTRVEKLNASILLGNPFYVEYLDRAGNTEQAIEHVRNALSAARGDALSLQCYLVKMLTRLEQYLNAANAFPKSTDSSVPVRDYILDARGSAAAAAIRAADGQGVGAAGLSVEQRAALRSQGLAWLSHNLELWLARRPHTQNTLHQIVQARDSGALESVYAAEPLSLLPGEEQQEWRRFWLNVDEAQRQLNQGAPDFRDQTN